jgi:AraC-like DNA-binding protein
LDRGVTIRHRVKRYIDEHLASPSLAPDLICSDVAVSRATLYRAFEPIGGVAAYIQTRRLEAAHAHLAQPDRQSKVASIGYALGFSSDAHFNKAFRRRFGFTPGTTRQNVMRKAAEVSTEDASALYREWVQSLTSR